jgi:hypothetical protein
MTAEVKLTTGKSIEQRVADRLKPSGDPRSDYHTQTGSGPTRVHHFIHKSGHVVFAETRARESGPQEQAHHDDATQQTTSYFRGHGKHEEEEHDD